MAVKDKETLKKAAEILQNAHDYIEVNGFNIEVYVASGPTKGQEPPACYIGTVRIAADVDPSDVSTGFSSDAGNGDGPELILALKAMDKIAKRRLGSNYKNEANQYWTPTGRFVEQLGFQIRDKAEVKFPTPDCPNSGKGYDWEVWHEKVEEVRKKQSAYQEGYALKLLRKALSDIYKEVA